MSEDIFNLKFDPSPSAKFKYGVISLLVGGAVSAITYKLAHHVAKEAVEDLADLLPRMYEINPKAP
jgi:hypothetical protein